ncbi:unnamed protein product [Bemisia tabaci]|uniref:Uncharacterized protein n=1 Tax=Bemisia tabaci TaxID=7038 RepID=A0A9P0A488_BEMTA|nr:unnamed protein product [Bemisia tabaci]
MNILSREIWQLPNVHTAFFLSRAVRPSLPLRCPGLISVRRIRAHVVPAVARRATNAIRTPPVGGARQHRAKTHHARGAFKSHRCNPRGGRGLRTEASRAEEKRDGSPQRCRFALESHANHTRKSTAEIRQRWALEGRRRAEIERPPKHDFLPRRARRRRDGAEQGCQFSSGKITEFNAEIIFSREFWQSCAVPELGHIFRAALVIPSHPFEDFYKSCLAKTKHSKLEKADILELTVRHLQREKTLNSEVKDKYRSGFQECITEFVSIYRSDDHPSTPTTPGHPAPKTRGIPAVSNAESISRSSHPYPDNDIHRSSSFRYIDPTIIPPLPRLRAIPRRKLAEFQPYRMPNRYLDRVIPILTMLYIDRVRFDISIRRSSLHSHDSGPSRAEKLAEFQPYRMPNQYLDRVIPILTMIYIDRVRFDISIRRSSLHSHDSGPSRAENPRTFSRIECQIDISVESSPS